jgi:hypothetical protein
MPRQSRLVDGDTLQQKKIDRQDRGTHLLTLSHQHKTNTNTLRYHDDARNGIWALLQAEAPDRQRTNASTQAKEKEKKTEEKTVMVMTLLYLSRGLRAAEEDYTHQKVRDRKITFTIFHSIYQELLIH